jgi:hypothetical protein
MLKTQVNEKGVEEKNLFAIHTIVLIKNRFPSKNIKLASFLSVNTHSNVVGGVLNRPDNVSFEILASGKVGHTHPRDEIQSKRARNIGHTTQQ